MNICLLMMGGSGTRFGANKPKQFVFVKDKPVFAYILKGLNDAESIDRIIVVTHKNWISFVNEWREILKAEKVYDVVAGGDTRSESVWNGLKKASEFAAADDVVMMHDATHPYVDDEGMKEMVAAVKEYGGATLGQRQFDTCYKIDENDFLVEVVPRQYIVSGASPEAFLFKDIFNIYNSATEEELVSMTSAGAIALEHGIKMKVCTLHSFNLKITYPNDMELLECAVDGYFFKEDKDSNEEFNVKND